MSDRESTASNIATDLLGRLNNKLRSELVRHVDEYFQKTDFQNSLAFPNVHESNTLDGLPQDSGNTQAVENLGPQAHQGADGQNTENPLSPLAEDVEIENEKSNSANELIQDGKSHDEKLEEPLENTDCTKESRSTLTDNSIENVRVEDKKSNSEKKPPQGVLAESEPGGISAGKNRFSQHYRCKSVF